MRELVFAAITTALSFLIYVFPLKYPRSSTFDAQIIEPLAIVPTTIIGLAVFVYFRTHVTSRLLSGAIYYGMGIGFIAFWVFNAGLLLSLLLPDFTVEIGLICLVISVIACFKAILNGKNVELKTIHLMSPKIERHHKFIFISDIHLGSNSKRHLEKICDKIRGLNYEHLLIGGDLFDSSAFDTEDLGIFKSMKTYLLCHRKS